MNIDVHNFQSRTEPVTTLTERYIEWKNENVSMNRSAGKPFDFPLLFFSRSSSSAHLTFELAGETDIHISAFNLRGKKWLLFSKAEKKGAPKLFHGIPEIKKVNRKHPMYT